MGQRAQQDCQTNCGDKSMSLRFLTFGLQTTDIKKAVPIRGKSAHPISHQQQQQQKMNIQSC